ncbi:MAG: hypothetical protein QOH32_2726 [Bradyrhizobium sp.]|jgi:hypothetical protein|nr:hypothetical protein [Bradyrhizobium sp.]
MKKELTYAVVGLCAFTAGLSVSFFTLPLWVATIAGVARQGNRSDWLGFAGGIAGNSITAAVTIAAIYFAWMGIKQQLRISLISREEERIEKVLPGLKEMAGALQEDLPNQRDDPEKIIKYLRRFRGWFNVDGLSQQERQMVRANEDRNPHFSIDDSSLARIVPLADSVTRQRLLIILQQLKEEAEAMPNENVGPVAGLRELPFRTAIYNLRNFFDEIVQRTDTYEARLKRFRPELEDFFEK